MGLHGRVAVVLATSIASSGLLACNSPTARDTSRPPAVERVGASATLVRDARAVTARALAGPVFTPEAFPTDPRRVTRYAGWLGPRRSPRPPTHATVDVIPCSTQVAECQIIARHIERIGKLLHWEVSIVDGRGTPESFVRSFSEAVAQRPSAIVTVGLPDAIVSRPLREAREAGVVTVGISTGERHPADGYDGYVPARDPFMYALNAWAIIARSNGKADVLLLRDPQYPTLLEGFHTFKAIMAGCPACTVHDVDFHLRDATDPNKVYSAISHAVNERPEAQYLVVPYSFPVPFIAEALRQLGRDSIAVVAKDSDPNGLAALRRGSSLFNAGIPLEWMAYAAIDQAIRGLRDEPLLTGRDIGMALTLFDRSKAPPDNSTDSYAWPDYRTRYHRLWGLGGRPSR